MSTAVEGIYMNPRGWLPIGGVAVTAFATTGQSEGSDTTDSNGHFRITGLTNRNWLVKATGQPPDFGVFILVPVTLLHGDLQTVTEDQHHAGFVGLVDNNGNIIEPDADNRITFKDDGIVNVDLSAEPNQVSVTLDLDQLPHGSIANLGSDDHTQYVVGQGRADGQTLIGGLATGKDLTLSSNITGDGSVILGTTSLFEFDEAAGQLKLATSGSSAGLLLGGDALLYRVSADVLRTPDALTVDSTVTGSTFDATGATSDGDNSALGYEAAKGAVLTGQGSTDDITVENDAGAKVFGVPTGTTIVDGLSELKFTERADHISTPGAGFGYLWVKSDAPSSLIYTDDAGTDFTLPVASSAHGTSVHTEGTADRMTWQDASGDDEEFAVGADGTVLLGKGTTTVPAFGKVDLTADIENVLPEANLPNASLTAEGVVELATAAEITTGTDTGRAISPDAFAGSEPGERAVQIHVIDSTTEVTTGDGKAYFHVDSRLAGMNLVDVHGEAITAGTTGTMDIQLRNVTQSADILSTKLTFDSTESGTDTAATPAVISGTEDDMTENDVIAVDVDAVQTTKAKGLIITMGFRLP